MLQVSEFRRASYALLLASALLPACAQQDKAPAQPIASSCANPSASVNQMQVIVQLKKNTTPNTPALLQSMKQRSGAVSISYVRNIGPDMHVYSIQYYANCADHVVARIRELPEVNLADVDGMKQIS